MLGSNLSACQVSKKGGARWQEHRRRALIYYLTYYTPWRNQSDKSRGLGGGAPKVAPFDSSSVPLDRHGDPEGEGRPVGQDVVLGQLAAEAHP